MVFEAMRWLEADPFFTPQSSTRAWGKGSLLPHVLPFSPLDHRETFCSLLPRGRQAGMDLSSLSWVWTQFNLRMN